MVIFNSYVSLPEVNLHFPMVFLWFSYGFPMFVYERVPETSRRVHQEMPDVQPSAPPLAAAAPEPGPATEDAEELSSEEKVGYGRPPVFFGENFSKLCIYTHRIHVWYIC